MIRPLLLFAPGAGAPSTHPWMQRWGDRLRAIGDIELFDYSYRHEGRRRPDHLPELIAAHRQALEKARGIKASAPVVLIGKSMGGRIGAHVSLQEKVEALIFLSYPLCGGGDRTKLRDQVLRLLTTPVLFVQGTRDPLCPLDLLADVRRSMTTPNFLYVVEGGDHSLLVPKRTLSAKHQTQDDVDERTLDAIAEFVKGL